MPIISDRNTGVIQVAVSQVPKAELAALETRISRYAQAIEQGQRIRGYFAKADLLKTLNAVLSDCSQIPSPKVSVHEMNQGRIGSIIEAKLHGTAVDDIGNTWIYFINTEFKEGEPHSKLCVAKLSPTEKIVPRKKKSTRDHDNLSGIASFVTINNSKEVFHCLGHADTLQSVEFDKIFHSGAGYVAGIKDGKSALYVVQPDSRRLLEIDLKGLELIPNAPVYNDTELYQITAESNGRRKLIQNIRLTTGGTYESLRIGTVFAGQKEIELLA